MSGFYKITNRESPKIVYVEAVDQGDGSYYCRFYDSERNYEDDLFYDEHVIEATEVQEKGVGVAIREWLSPYGLARLVTETHSWNG